MSFTAPGHGFVAVPNIEVQTTRTAVGLFFADMVGSFATSVVAGSNVTDVSLMAVHSFEASLDAAGRYTVARGVAEFVISAKVDGVAVISSASNLTALSGTYNEASGHFTMVGTILDAENSVAAVLDLRLKFSNRPPTARITAPAEVECVAMLGTPVHLSAEDSTDPEGAVDIKAFGWVIDPDRVDRISVNGMEVDVTLGLGQHDVWLTVKDASGAFSMAKAVVVVRDTTAPTVTVSVDPSCLFPPNHKLTLYRLGTEIKVSAADACDSSLRVEIVGITSTDPWLGPGQGMTTPDFLFGPNAACVRSERAGLIGDRQYRIRVQASSATGPSTQVDAVVDVPHDRRAHQCRETSLPLAVEDDDSRCVEPPASASSTQPVATNGCSSIGSPSLTALLGVFVLMAMRLARGRRAQRRVVA